MAQYVGPKYNVTDFDASRWRDLMSNVFSTGIVKGARPQASAGGDMAVTNPSGLNYSVATGVAMIKGSTFVIDAAVTGALAAADPTFPRIDTVIASWNYASGVPTCSISVKQGTAASSPVAPSLTQNDTTYEFPLADLRVNAGASVVATLTDRRAYCAAILSYPIGHSANNVPVSDGNLNTNLNADMVDGYHAGNATGDVPLSNGTLNINLNADMVDGYHAGNVNGDVPVNNGTVNTNLNADMVDGVHASGLVNTGAGNMANTPVQMILVGPSSANLPAAGTKGRIAVVVPFSLP